VHDCFHASFSRGKLPTSGLHGLAHFDPKRRTAAEEHEAGATTTKNEVETIHLTEGNGFCAVAEVNEGSFFAKEKKRSIVCNPLAYLVVNN